MGLIVVAEEDIEAVLFWNAGRAAGAVAPFAKAAGDVAGPLEDGAERLFAFTERIETAVGANRHVTGVLAGEQRERVGAQTGPPARHCLNRTPSAASRSIFGVR